MQFLGNIYSSLGQNFEKLASGIPDGIVQMRQEAQALPKAFVRFSLVAIIGMFAGFLAVLFANDGVSCARQHGYESAGHYQCLADSKNSKTSKK